MTAEKLRISILHPKGVYSLLFDYPEGLNEQGQIVWRDGVARGVYDWMAEFRDEFTLTAEDEVEEPHKHSMKIDLSLPMAIALAFVCKDDSCLFSVIRFKAPLYSEMLYGHTT